MELSSNRSSIVLFFDDRYERNVPCEWTTDAEPSRFGDRSAGSAGCHPPSGLGQYCPGAKYFGGKGSKLQLYMVILGYKNEL